MSSVKLFPYKIYKGQWFRAKDLTDSDIAVIVDTDSDIIWYFEGDKSSARMRSHAREILGQLKKKYVKYTFKRVSPNTPEPILIKLDDLKKESFKGNLPGVKLGLRDFSRLFYILGIIAGGLLAFSFIYLLTALGWAQDTETYAHSHYIVNYISLTSYFDIVSFSALFAFILAVISAFFGAIIQKKAFSILITITAAISFFAFFILRIWDVMIFFEQVGNIVFLREDTIYLYLLIVSILEVLGILFAFYGAITGFKGLKTIELIEPKEEPSTSEKKPESEPKKSKVKSLPKKKETPQTTESEPEVKKSSQTMVKKPPVKRTTKKPSVKKTTKNPSKEDK